ncbi:HAAS signaling domain-containing protein [Nocardioides lijunqiniae]|uniref:HAAS signaling domain-containing protein n=1 Tax=Nocardioides lijunqiniae TaxID=2760832 RepID=UPI0018776438|nr:hypothetical protein [Nocardioides lijunqiniae]
MNDTRTPTRPEVEAFVADVRARLADLSDDEREELLGGLEADLSDQVADGADVLGDPAAYAAELRAAAGLPERSRSRRRLPLPGRPTRASLTDDLDRLRARFFELVESHPWSRQAWAIAEAARPAWWVLRAWIAVTFVDQATGEWEYVTLLPTLGVTLLGPAVLLAAIVVSVLIGLGRLWPGSGPDRPLLPRLALIAANVAAVVVSLGFASAGQHGDIYSGTGYNAGYRAGHHQPGLRVDSVKVRSLFVYDAQGNPVEGAQIFRGNGDPLAIEPEQAAIGRRENRKVGCGWFNGTTQLFNVFPLAEREQRRGTCLDEPGTGDGAVSEAQPPFAVVPPVTSPVPPAVVAPVPSAGPTAVVTPKPQPKPRP